MQSVSSVETQIAQILPLRRMLDVERQMPNRKKFFASETRICRSLKIWTGLKKMLLGFQARCNDFCVILSLPQKTRDEVSHSPELVWMHMEGYQPESAGTGMGADDSIEREGLEPSSFAAAGDHLPVQLNSSFSAAYLGISR